MDRANRILATFSLLVVIASPFLPMVLDSPTAQAENASFLALTWLALIAVAGIAGAALRAEARRLQSSRQLLFAIARRP